MCRQDGRIAQADRQSGEHDRGLNHHPDHRTTEQPFMLIGMKLGFEEFFRASVGKFSHLKATLPAIDSRIRSAEQQNTDQLAVCQLLGRCG